MPKRLQKLEDHLAKNKTKFLCADNVTLADFAMGVHLIKEAYNPKFDHEHIVLAVNDADVVPDESHKFKSSRVEYICGTGVTLSLPLAC